MINWQERYNCNTQKIEEGDIVFDQEEGEYGVVIRIEKAAKSIDDKIYCNWAISLEQLKNKNYIYLALYLYRSRIQLYSKKHEIWFYFS